MGAIWVLHCNAVRCNIWTANVETLSVCAQVLVTGKISQAVVVAAAAYRTEAEFRERTGVQHSKLIVDEFHTNTHVCISHLYLLTVHSSLHANHSDSGHTLAPMEHSSSIVCSVLSCPDLACQTVLLSLNAMSCCQVGRRCTCAASCFLGLLYHFT